MNDLSKNIDPTSIKESPKIGKIAKGVATGVAVSTIVQSGRGIIGTLAKNRLVIFGAGLVAGYFAHKYRKEIISASSYAAHETRDFALRQKEHLKDLLAETQELAEESDDPARSGL